MDATLDLDEQELQDWTETLSCEEKPKWYAERYVNEVVAVKHGFEGMHCELKGYDKYKLEFADLRKDDCLYFVKIGTPQKMNYVVDQSTVVARYLQDHKGSIRIADETIVTPKKMCLWLILDRNTPVTKVTDLRSLIFLMKINDWRRQVENTRLSPEIRISYRR